MNNYFNNNGTNNNSNNNNFRGMITMVNGTIQTLEAFATIVKDFMEAHLEGEHRVEIHKVTKNNGLCLTGITIKDNRSNAAPTIYLDGAYEQYKAGAKMFDICAEVLRAYERSAMDTDIDVSTFTDFTNVKDKICYKLVNAERNQELLKGVPHKLFHDLAVIYYIPVLEATEYSGTITVTKDLQNHWGVDDITLYDLAYVNTARLYGESISGMSDMLMELMSRLDETEDTYEMMDKEFMCQEVEMMYVATNKKKMFGACVMLSEILLRWFASRIDRDFFILPSSVHELIFVPAMGTDKEMQVSELKRMVYEVNYTQVAVDEVLSDNVYYYNRETGCVEIC